MNIARYQKGLKAHKKATKEYKKLLNELYNDMKVNSPFKILYFADQLGISSSLMKYRFDNAKLTISEFEIILKILER